MLDISATMSMLRYIHIVRDDAANNILLSSYGIQVQ
jgi:hypothetical protein